MLRTQQNAVTERPRTAIHHHPAIIMLEWAAMRSYHEDVRTPHVLSALAELEAMAQYASPFVAYRRALDLEDHQARWTATLTAFASIAGAIDLTQLTKSLQPRTPADLLGESSLLKELDIGLLFADIAMQAKSSPQKARDCARHARNAYQTVIQNNHQAGGVHNSGALLQSRLSRLKSALVDLGELI